MVPQELTQYRQWVCWRYEDDGTGKPTKVPYTPFTANKASVMNSADWTDYATACNALQTGWYSGIGFVFTESDPFCGVDMDDPAGDPEWIERHGKLYNMLETYCEWSPSGKGLHAIARARVLEGRRRGKLEIYSSKRFFTVTGNTVKHLPINDCNSVLQLVWDELGRDRVEVLVSEKPQTQSDFDIYETASNAENGQKFVDLWAGQYESYYSSQSEADFALINMLSFYSRNIAQIERMFLVSGLGYRLASGAKKKARNYVPNMIQRSFDNQMPEVDLTALKLAAQKAYKPPKVTLTQPQEPALKWDMPPGLIGELTQFIYAQAPLPVAEVALAGALGLMAGICGRAFNVSSEGLNMYLLVLAQTGNGKEAMARGIDKIMSAVEKTVKAAGEFRGPGEIASGPALTKHLANQAPSCVSLLGEFGLRLHAMCSENANAQHVGLRRLLLDLFHKSGASGSLRPHVYSDKAKNTDILYSPAFSILGESTPETFYRHLDESMISDGLLPRFACIEYTGERVSLNRKHASVVPDDGLVQRMTELCTAVLGMHANHRVLNVQLTPEAEEMSYALTEEYTRRINADKENEIARQLYNRAHIKVLKLAALIAVGVNYLNPIVTVEQIQWGVAFVERDIKNTLHKFQIGKVGRETGETNQAADLIHVIRDYLSREYDATMAKYRVPAALKNSNIVPYAYLHRFANGRASFKQDRVGATFAINRALMTLQHEGLIREVKETELFKNFGVRMRAYAVTDPSAFS